jgi:serine protease
MRGNPRDSLSRTAQGVLLALSLVAMVGAAADELDPSRKQPATTDVAPERIIVKLRAERGGVQPTAEQDRVAGAAARAGLKLREWRRVGAGTRLNALRVEPQSPGEPIETQLERLRADPSVEYAEVDRRRYISALPNDPLYTGQWYLQSRSDAPSAVDAEHAWDVTTGTTGLVVAVIDTGVRFEHPDLGRAEEGGRLLPGYDFVADAVAANDGDGRDANASDPGDWVTAADAGTKEFSGCTVADSSWHGTRVAGILGAATNDADGIAGTTWSGWLLPVRVLGKCGGYDSDILSGMLWAAGISVAGVPDNPYPAQVENLSLGATGPCPASYQDVVDQLAARGVTVVASAGNEGGPVDAPADCRGVAGVAGLRHAGTKVGYSSLGPEVAVGAPAGNCVNLSGACLYSIDTATNTGTTSPSGSAYTDQLSYNVGTSFSAPMVSGVAGLMLAVNGRLAPADLIARLQEGAAAFPPATDPSVPQCHVPAGPGDAQPLECSCTTSTCGAGMLNAPGALSAAVRPIAVIDATGSVAPGQPVTLSAQGSSAACGHGLASYAWSVVDAVGVGVVGADTAVATVDAPATGQYTVRLVVTDDAGRLDSADVVLTANAATTTPRAAAGAEPCLPALAPPPPVSVSVTPGTASVAPGATQQFTATVANSGDGQVLWAVEGVYGGNLTVGTISAQGLYTAPANVSSSATFTVTAAWNEERTTSGSATVTVAPAVTPAASSKHGGGRIDAMALVLLFGLVLARRRGSALGARRR